MRPKGSAKELEVRRRIGGKLLQGGKGVREVARLVEASPSSVSRWKQALEEGGMEALRAKPHPGRRARLRPDVSHLLQAVNVSITNTRKNRRLIHSFFKYAGLEL